MNPLRPLKSAGSRLTLFGVTIVRWAVVVTARNTTRMLWLFGGKVASLVTWRHEGETYTLRAVEQAK